MHVPSIETHGKVCDCESFVHVCLVHSKHTLVPSRTLLSTLNNSSIQQFHPMHSMLVIVSVGFWTQFFRLLSMPSSQQPLGYSRARRWCAVFFPRLQSSVAHFSGPSLAPKPVCRGAVRTQLLAGPSGYSRLLVRFGNANAREAAYCERTSFGMRLSRRLER